MAASRELQRITTQCAIAGGGPAGVMLGYLLARSGIEVVILEKWPDFLRDFRGDTIHPSTMEILHELGILDDFLNLPHNKVRQVTGQFGGNLVTIADFSRLRTRAPFVAFTPQWNFLDFLASKGRAYQQFNLMMGVEVTGIIEESGSIVGLTAINEGGKFEVRADLVVGADGRHSTVRESAAIEVEDLGAHVDVLWFRLSRQSTDPDQLFGIVDEGKLLVMIDRGDYWQCAFTIVKGDFERIKEGAIEDFRQSIARLAPFTSTRVDELHDWEEIKLLSVAVDHLKRWYRPGLLCIGDAAHAMSPIGGVGINLAIQDAVAAANVLVPAFKEGTPTEQELARIQQRREGPTRKTQRLQVTLQERVLFPYLESEGTARLPFVLRLFNWFPPLRAIPARFIGIGFRPEHIEHRD